MQQTTLVPGSAAARALFPITTQRTYLNHAAVSPLSTRVLDALDEWNRHWRDRAATPDLELPIDAYRERFATLIGATAGEIAFTPNTTSGLLAVALGLSWQEGDVLLTAAGEFPANVYPWRPLTDRGVRIVTVEGEAHRILPERLEAALEAHPTTRLLTLSHVSFATGARQDLAALGEICRAHGVYFLVDAVQSAGVMAIDVRSMKIDFLAAGGHKWLMGPLGAGFFYVRSDLIERLRPVTQGWLSVVDPRDFYDLDQPLADGASRFENGTLPWTSLTGLAASVETLLEVGVDRTACHVHALGDRLIQGLQRRACTIVTPLPAAHRGGIVCFRHPIRSSATLVSDLDHQRISVAERGPLVRVSPHYYNNTDDIDRLLAALDAPSV